MSKTLVIVESPAKAKTIKKYLGAGYDVLASKGHLKDLPKGPKAVDVSNDFAETYTVIEGKEKILEELKAAARKSDEVLLATDPDREGEAIAFHIADEIKSPKLKVARVEFHEITKKGIDHGVSHPRKLDENLYDAQRARRVLDRIVGYDVSALVWSKLAFGLSAGRVQSVALRLIVDREREIEAFVPEEYWNIGAALFAKKDGATFLAKLAQVGDDKATGHQRRTSGRHPPGPRDRALPGREAHPARATPQRARALHDEQAPAGRDELPPLRHQADDAGRAGALRGHRSQARRRAGRPHHVHAYGLDARLGRRRRRGAEAHREALRQGVRPREAERLQDEEGRAGRPRGDPSDQRRHPPGLDPQVPEGRAVQALQDDLEPLRRLADGAGGVRPDHRRRRGDAASRTAGERALWTPRQRAHPQVRGLAPGDRGPEGVRRRGRRGRARAGRSGRGRSGRGEGAEGGDGAAARKSEPPPALEEDADGLLPELEEGEALALAVPPGVVAEQKFTQPPARYNEGSLVRELEKRGIGRPSTYAEIIGKVQARAYVEKLSSGGFQPTLLGKFIVDGLVKSELDFMDPNFTAEMEEELDDVGSGKLKRVQLLKRFYKRFREQLDKSKKLKPWKPEAEKTDVVCELCGAKMLKKWSKNGYFLSCETYPDCKGSMNLAADGAPAPVRQTDIICDKCGKPMVIKTGRHGEFIGCSGYPACDNTRPIPLGIACPQCGGDLIEIRARKRGGRTFYGCSNWNAEQKCDFKLWQKPIPVPCPKCGAKFLTRGGGKQRPMLICATKECGYKKEIEDEADLLAGANGDAAPVVGADVNGAEPEASDSKGPRSSSVTKKSPPSKRGRSSKAAG